MLWGILLPVDEVAARADVERVGQDRRAAMRRRAQANQLRREVHQTVVAILRDVVEGDVNGHDALYASRDLCRQGAPTNLYG